MKSIFILFSFLLLIEAEGHGGGFSCPDEYSLELLEKARASQTDGDDVSVIEQASKRSMDDLALRLACSNLARRTFRSQCTDYGYECPDPGADIMRWPAQISDWVPQLKANVPALKLCPDVYIGHDPKLPIVRFKPVLTRDIVKDGVTGWVTLMLVIDGSGKVTDAVVQSSTSPRLEASALEAARRFLYLPELKDGVVATSTIARATIYFHYWDLAKAAGCSMGDD